MKERMVQKEEKMNSQRKVSYKILLAVALTILSLAAAVSKILIGFDVDEGYGISMPYRMLQGDKMLLDMWEIHQTSSFLPYLFLALFTKLTGSNTGIVIYARVIATIIHLLFSFWVYQHLSKRIEKEWSFLCGLLYFNFLPKWIMSLDFSMQLLWGMTAMLLLLSMSIRAEKKKESIYLFLAGVSLACTVLGYPTMVVLYPVAIWLIWKSNEKSMKKVGFFTLGCGICAILFFGYLLSYMTVGEIASSIPHIFSDGSHQFDMMTKWKLFFQRWLEAFFQAFVLLVPCTILAFCCKVTVGRKSSQNGFVCLVKEHFLVLFVLVFMTISSLIVVFANLAGISWGPFRLQVRYLVLFVLAFFLVKRIKEKKIRDYLLISTLVAFLGILLASNVGPVSSSSYLVLGILALVLIFYFYGKNCRNKWTEGILYAGVSLFVLSLIFCKGYYVRVSEYPPANILEERKQVTFGPLKGIYIYHEDLERAEAFQEAIEKGEEGEKLLLLSTEGIYNLYGKGTYVTPTTISTPAFNEQWVEYFMLHEEHMPDRIIIGKNTVDDLEKFFCKNPFGIWIKENYDIENRKEDEYLCVIRK